MANDLTQTERTTVRRHAERGSFDRARAHQILDEGYYAQVGFVVDGGPRVLPMAYARIGEVLYLHGAVGNAMLRASGDAEVCVAVTLLDALVMARSAFNHSMNYRSLVIIGVATKVTDEFEKRRAFDAFAEQVLPGRSATARPASDAESRATLVLRIPIAEGSVKVRNGPVEDEPGDLDLPVWAGIIPLSTVPGEPVQDALQVQDPDLAGLEPPVPTRPVTG